MCKDVKEKDMVIELLRDDFKKNIQESINLIECAEVVLRCLKKSIVEKNINNIKSNANDNNSTSN